MKVEANDCLHASQSLRSRDALVLRKVVNIVECHYTAPTSSLPGLIQHGKHVKLEFRCVSQHQAMLNIAVGTVSQ